MRRRLLGRTSGGDICTPYGTPLPYNTGLLSHCSIYNICDIWTLNDQTLPLSEIDPPQGNRCAWLADLSGNGNPFVDASSVPNDDRSFTYQTDAGVYGDCDASPSAGFVGYTINTSWRINSDVKTIILLVQVDDVSSSNSTRFIQGQLVFRFASGNLQVFDGVLRNSSLAGSSNTWHIVSLRTDGNVVVGLDKSYQQVKATAPTITNTDFSILNTANPVNKFLGRFREIITFSGSISDSNVDNISDWLTTKWNL